MNSFSTDKSIILHATMTVDITHVGTHGGPPYFSYTLIPGHLIQG